MLYNVITVDDLKNIIESQNKASCFPLRIQSKFCD